MSIEVLLKSIDVFLLISARMTVHDALNHPWLRENRPELDSRIPSNRFDDIRQRIRDRYVCKLLNIIKEFIIICLYSLINRTQLLVSAVWLIGAHSAKISHKIIIFIIVPGV